MKYSRGIFGFTLVELLVVVTIIAILATVGFVSYSGYLTGVRDSSRLSQLQKLTDSLQVYGATNRLPIPDDYVEIYASGSLVAYQGFAGVDVLEAMDYTNGGKDPKDKKYFTYYVDKNRQSFQLLALLEEEQSLALQSQDVYAADYSNRFKKVYGKKLGILTAPDTHVPIQEITGVSEVDIVLTTDSYVANISDTQTISGTGILLRQSIANANCNRIKEVGEANGNDTYTINPSGAGEIVVYCEMENAGGGWTLVGRSVSGSSGNIGWGESSGNPSVHTSHYSLGERVTDIDFTEIMAARYSVNKRIDYSVTMSVNDANLDTSSSSTFTTSGCSLGINTGLSSTEKTWNHCTGFTYWGYGNSNLNFFFRNSGTTSSAWGLLPGGFSLGSYDASFGAFHGKQGMVFVR